MPVCSNGLSSLTLKSCNGAVGSDRYEIPSSLLHVIHVPTIFFTTCQPLVDRPLHFLSTNYPILTSHMSQYFLIPFWYTLLGLSLIVSSVM